MDRILDYVLNAGGAGSTGKGRHRYAAGRPQVTAANVLLSTSLRSLRRRVAREWGNDDRIVYYRRTDAEQPDASGRVRHTQWERITPAP